jgi:hypothetical protein
MEDAIKKTDIDGYMIDWVWNPSSKLRDAGWLLAEQKLFEQLTGKPFPKSGRPDDGEKLEYERKAIERCWARIKETRDRVNPQCAIWLSCNNFTNPTIAGSKMLREVDWSMNESPDPKYFLTGQQMAGPHTRMIQNVVGWASHDAEKFLAKPDNRALDLYGFATPRPTSLLPPIEYYLKKPAVQSHAYTMRIHYRRRRKSVRRWPPDFHTTEYVPQDLRPPSDLVVRTESAWSLDHRAS